MRAHTQKVCMYIHIEGAACTSLLVLADTDEEP